MLAKLNDYAYQVSENGAISVELDANGVYWLKLAAVQTNPARTLAPVGYKGCPIRYIRTRIEEYFAAR
jgi:hypothetical protein